MDAVDNPWHVFSVVQVSCDRVEYLGIKANQQTVDIEIHLYNTM